MMVKTLLNKGWSKNEILFEVQRIYGNDVIIFTKFLDDERTMLGKIFPVAGAAFFISTFLWMYKRPA